jgi:hypothetical protein
MNACITGRAYTSHTNYRIFFDSFLPRAAPQYTC